MGISVSYEAAPLANNRPAQLLQPVLVQREDLRVTLKKATPKGIRPITDSSLDRPRLMPPGTQSADKAKKPDDLHAARKAKAKESLEKMNQAKKSGKFEQIFGWVVPIVVAIVGVILLATGLSPQAGILMLSSAIVVLTKKISPDTGAWLDKIMEDVDPILIRLVSGQKSHHGHIERAMTAIDLGGAMGVRLSNEARESKNTLLGLQTA
jgi:hypothetical protein